MKYRNLLLIIPCLLLVACEGLSSDPTYKNTTRDEMYKYGSLLSEEGGWDIIGGKDKKKASDYGIGVNAFLWRASLDTIAFLPISSADPFGGLILTDWYSAPDAPNERTKLNVHIRDRELTAAGVKVSVFRQIKDSKGIWQDAAVSEATAEAIENAILAKARQIRIGQKQFQ
ncbi:MAG: DUF3576 domain-containing protein [Alphaproteobacteria bacterium]|nr:DUF3576 domain-containing protein [Alphaproteobacteria bacterium]MCL2505260.1 DUF3576 domain-containing protein [Alphaproteobacteria bacterium]